MLRPKYPLLSRVFDWLALLSRVFDGACTRHSPVSRIGSRSSPPQVRTMLERILEEKEKKIKVRGVELILQWESGS